MSFAAVAALIAVAEWEQRRPRDVTGIPIRFAAARRYMRGIAITSFVGSLATMPYAAFHFDRATHYAVLGNLGAMPIMGFVAMPAAAISVIAMPFGLDAWPLKVMGWGIDAMLAVGRYVSHLPGAVRSSRRGRSRRLCSSPAADCGSHSGARAGAGSGSRRLLRDWLSRFSRRRPICFVARDGQTVALRGKDGALHLLRPATDEYSANEWLKRDGDARLPTMRSRQRKTASAATPGAASRTRATAKRSRQFCAKTPWPKIAPAPISSSAPSRRVTPASARNSSSIASMWRGTARMRCGWGRR